MLPSVLLAFFPAAAEEARVDGHDGGWWEGTAALGQQGPVFRASARRWAGLRGRRRREEKPKTFYLPRRQPLRGQTVPALCRTPPALTLASPNCRPRPVSEQPACLAFGHSCQWTPAGFRENHLGSPSRPKKKKILSIRQCGTIFLRQQIILTKP